MGRLTIQAKLIAIATGVSLLAAGSVVVYWQYTQRQWCMKFTSTGGQEVTYSRGCYSPYRYKRWVKLASAQVGEADRE